MTNVEHEKHLAAKEAVKLIRNGQVVGLGTGSTAAYAIKEIGHLVKQGLQVTGVPTSEETKLLAQSLFIALTDIHAVHSIDITIDGADEFTTDCMLIKGGGGALFREKIVASLSREEIIIADASKKVGKLGKFMLPLAVTPFALTYVMDKIIALKGKGKQRIKNNLPFITDEGNYIIDADFGLIENPSELATQLDGITGLVEHGLFINLTTKIIMAEGSKVTIFE